MAYTVERQADGTYLATCRAARCGWTISMPSEHFAEELAQGHEEFMGHDAGAAALARYATLPVSVPIESLHLHSPACTDATCPGMGFPTRDELISARRARHGGRETQPVGPAGGPDTKRTEKSASNEVPF